MIRMRLRLIGPNIAEALKGVYLGIDDLGTFYRKWFVPQYLKDVQKNFETQGGLVGGWAPLSPEYNRWKQKHYPGKPINYLKGRLTRSMGVKGRSKYLEVEIQRRQASVTNTLPHAGWVQAMRPFMIPPGMLDSVVYSGLLNDYLEDVVKKAGLRGGRGEATPPAAATTSAFGPSFFDSPSRWTPAHWARWPEGPTATRDTSRSRKTMEDDDEE